MEKGTVEIVCRSCGGETRAIETEEELVHDLNLWIVGKDTLLENQYYWDFSAKGKTSAKVSMVYDRTYSIFALANAGYRIGCDSVEELENLKFHLNYPDGYAYGIPMAFHTDSFVARKGEALIVLLEKLMGKVCIRLDRSLLSDGVSMNVGAVRLYNCPKCVSVFSNSGIVTEDERFASGFCRYGADASPLNAGGGKGLSSVLSLYALENIQGSILNEFCSYVELEIDYLSDEWYSPGGKGLIYRFYLQDGKDYDIRRNGQYNITVTPLQDGLQTEDPWKMDKSALVRTEKEPYLLISPQGSTVDGVFYHHYYEAQPGDTLHFSLSAYPGNMELSLREDLVQDEMEIGHAMYSMDDDGKGFQVIALGKGLSMMEILAGEPLCEGETIAIRIK